LVKRVRTSCICGIKDSNSKITPHLFAIGMSLWTITHRGVLNMPSFFYFEMNLLMFLQVSKMIRMVFHNCKLITSWWGKIKVESFSRSKIVTTWRFIFLHMSLAMYKVFNPTLLVALFQIKKIGPMQMHIPFKYKIV
jgi:hypothetical protein